MLGYLSLDIICKFLEDHSFPRAKFSENCSLLRTDPLCSQTNIRPYLRAKWGLYTREIRHQFAIIRHVIELILRNNMLRQERVLSFRKNKYFQRYGCLTIIPIYVHSWSTPKLYKMNFLKTIDFLIDRSLKPSTVAAGVVKPLSL